jgi:putative transcriptional regulator
MSHAGSFLVARPRLHDPNFKRTVVLLLAHSSDGAFGLVVNRPSDVVAEGLSLPVYNGGPCPSPGLLLLHGHREWLATAPAASESAVIQEIAPGIFAGDTVCLERAREASEGTVLRVRAFTGYSGWGAGQLESELASGDWTVVPATGQLLWDTPLEELWDKLMPTRLPQPSLN